MREKINLIKEGIVFDAKPDAILLITGLVTKYL